MASRYFAASSPEEIGGAIMGRIDSGGAARDNSRLGERYNKWDAAHRHYYGFDRGFGNTSEVERGGEQGELSVVRVNRGRAVGGALIGLMTSMRMTWKPTARNGDVGARDSIQAASTTLEWLWKTQGLQRRVRHWVEQGVIYAESFMIPRWEPAAGSSTPVAGGGVEFEGDLVFDVVPPWRTRVDEDAKDFDGTPWIAVCLWANKYDLEELYQTDILGEPTEGRIVADSVSTRMLSSDLEVAASNERDLIPIWHFYHRVTPAMPHGRHVVLASSDCVLVDEDLDNGIWPVVRFAPSEHFETPHGYSSWWDVLGVQEEMDGLESAIASNQLTFGTQSIAMEAGTQMERENVSGIRIMTIPKGAHPPVPVSLAATPAEVFKHLDRLMSAQRDLAGLNDVAMGQPQTSQMNAEAFSLLASMAQQRNAPQIQEVLDATGRVGAVALAILSQRWPEQKKLAVQGDGGRTRYEDVDGRALRVIDRTPVEVGNPLEQTASGRVQLAQLFLQSGVKMDVQQLQQIVETGRFEPVTQPIRDALQYIAAENVDLRKGKSVQAHYADDHLAHAMEHKAIIDDPQARQDPGVIGAFEAHIGEHYALFYGLPNEQDPKQDPQYPVRIRALLGQQAPPMPPPPQPGAGGPPPGTPQAMQPPGPAPTGAEQLPTVVPQPQ